MSMVTDKLLQLVAAAPIDSVEATCRAVCEHVDEAVAKLDFVAADRWRNVSRVVDAMAGLRFPDEWPDRSPARRHDRERNYAAITPAVERTTKLVEIPF